MIEFELSYLENRAVSSSQPHRVQHSGDETMPSLNQSQSVSLNMIESGNKSFVKNNGNKHYTKKLTTSRVSEQQYSVTMKER